MRSRYGGLIRRGLTRLLLSIVGLWCTGLLLFSFLPVPFSAVMVERQLSAWFSGDVNYIAHSDWVSINQISPWMRLAVIASEDQKFPDHWGFDMESISNALEKSRRHKVRLRGASTLSQQTVKNLFLWDGHSWIRKGLEAGLTVAMEGLWSKRRILAVYLNIAEFGKGIFGVEAAARHYFHKPASQLTPDEAAMLAAVLPNPQRFSVDAPSFYVRSRQQWIVRQMKQLGGENYLSRHHLY